MSKQPLISVLVAVYNTEQYVGECLTSILAQTYTNWEAIIINDGSSDNSAKILDEFAAKDSRICVFHQKNGGAGKAKNKAIEQARGEWLYFLDSDDYIDTTTLQELATLADDDVDIVTLGMRIVGDETEIRKRKIEGTCWKSIPSQYSEFFRQTFSNCELPLRMIRTSLVKEYGIKNDEGTHSFEDIGFCLRLAAVAKYVKHTGKVLYNYRIRANSSVDRLICNIKDYNIEKLEVLHNCMEWYDQKNVLNGIKDYLPHYFTQMINHYLADAAQDKRHLAFDFVREMETRFDMKLYENNAD